MRTSRLVCLFLLTASPLAAAQEAMDRARVNPMASSPLERFAATRERPLFSEGRRPPPSRVEADRAPEPPPKAEPPEPPRVTVVGVLRNEQGTRALVRPKPADKVREVRVGDEIGGWKVEEIGPRRVILASETRTKAFTLFEKRGGPDRVTRENERP
jgi:general secretion pathway protein N